MTSFEHFELSRDDADIAWLTIDVKGRSANILSQQVMEELIEAVDSLAQIRRRIRVRSGKKGGSSSRGHQRIRIARNAVRGGIAYCRGAGMFQNRGDGLSDGHTCRRDLCWRRV